MDELRVLASTVREVQVFSSGAVVTRVAALPRGGSWPADVAVDGLPLALEDESVRVSVVGSDSAPLPLPGDVRVVLVVPEPTDDVSPPSAEERDEAQRAVARIGARIRWLDDELALRGRVTLTLAPEEGGKPPLPAPFAAWLGFLEWDARIRRARSDERARLVRELEAARERVAQLARRDAEARAWRDARGETVAKRVIVRLRAGTKLAAGEGEPALRLEYRVPGARWVPTYVLRLARDGRSAELAVRAHVVQATGEPWERVRLSFSTASLTRDAGLPELRSLRIGRRQPEPARKAWREPPVGADALFEGLDRALAALGPAPLPPAPPPPDPFQATLKGGAPGGALLDALMASDPFAGGPSFTGADPFGGAPLAEETGHGIDLEDALPRAVPPPPPSPGRAFAPPPMPMAAPSPMAPPPSFGAPVRGGAAPPAQPASPPLPPSPPRPAALEPAADLLRYSGLAMASWDEPRHVRGRLRPLTWRDHLAGLDPAQLSRVARRLDDARRRAESAASVALPTGTSDVSHTAGSFDYRYDAEGLVDVPCDGSMHGVPLFGRRAQVSTTLVVVPRESTEAVRVATLRNPLEAPLLAGPAEIYLEDEFLASSSLRTVPVAGDLTVGLGVEEGLKVARNVFFEEEAKGLLGGRAVLRHRVEIEVGSRLPVPVSVEVRDRVPVLADGEKEIEVADEKATPPWEPFSGDLHPVKGGRRWRLTLEPGKTTALKATYAIRIDAKNELVGGNRRD